MNEKLENIGTIILITRDILLVVLVFLLGLNIEKYDNSHQFIAVIIILILALYFIVKSIKIAIDFGGGCHL